MNELQAQLQEVTDQLAQLDPNNRDNLVEIAGLEQKKAVLIMMMVDAMAQEEQQAAQMVRIQAQEEKVATLTLPYDFNVLYEDTTANDSIVEVVQIFLRKANDEHNAEVETMIAQHREEIRVAGEREVQLKRQNDELQAANKNLTVVVGDLSNENNQLTLERDEAFSYRDAAVTKAEGLELLLSEKETHIQTLRDEAAIGASRAINVTAIEASDRLAQLVEQSKSAKIKSAAELALESAIPFRGKVLVDGVVAPPIAPEVPTFQPEHPQADIPTDSMDETGPIPISADHQEVTFRPDEGTVSQEVQVVDGNSAAPVAGATITRDEIDQIKARIDRLEKEVNLPELQVAV